MPDYTVHFDTDTQTTKETLSSLISDIGTVDWAGDNGTFAGSGMASGVKGKVAVAQGDPGTTADFSYSLPLKLKVLSGKIDSQIRKGIERKGGTIV